MEPLPARRKPVPLSARKYAVQFTMEEDMHEDLLAVQALLGHALPSGDVAEVFRRAVRELRRKLEKQKFAKCARPRPQRGAAKGRHIPAAVKRAVCERDGDRCTFVSDQGKRCEARRALEFDHVEAFARGGESTIGNLRLRCRAHNQFEAECAFSAEFMAGKREQARERAARAKAESSARAKANAEAKARARAEAQSKANAEAEANAAAKARAAVEAASQKEVISWLRALGCNAERARQAAARCEGMADAPLETRVFVACQGLAPRSARRALPMASGPS